MTKSKITMAKERNTNHPATLLMIKDTIEKGQTRVVIGQTAEGELARLETSRHPKNGITIQGFAGDKEPVTISGLTLEQADAIGWLFAAMC